MLLLVIMVYNLFLKQGVNMDILIGGGGKVGYNLAKILSKQHNITIIDNNLNSLNYINESLDVLTIAGDLKETLTYNSLDKNYDFYLAITNDDETNIISSFLIDDFTDIKEKIARIKNTSYSLSSINKKANIKNMIYSYTITASHIEKLLFFPQANNVKEIISTDIFLLSVESEIDIEIEKLNEDYLKIIAIVRDEKIIFDENKILKGDLVYLISPKEKKEILKILAPSQKDSIENILIFGTDPLAIEIAKKLNKYDLNIKMIEKDTTKAHKAAKILQEEVMIINSSFEDETLFKSENLNINDMSIAATRFDENNIMKSLIAKKYGIKKTVCINNNPSYHSIMHSLHLPVVRGPKINTMFKILETLDSKDIIFEQFFMGFEGKLFIKKLYFNKTIKLPKENAKFILIRNNQLIEIKNTIETKQGDILLYFNTSGNRSWIENL